MGPEFTALVDIEKHIDLIRVVAQRAKLRELLR
jgi:hypothetical protein